MGNYINGYNKPRFRITDISGVLVEIIDLPICMVQGLTESYKKLFNPFNLFCVFVKCGLPASNVLNKSE